jgi:hypothetical protein
MKKPAKQTKTKIRLVRKGSVLVAQANVPKLSLETVNAYVRKARNREI